MRHIPRIDCWCLVLFVNLVLASSVSAATPRLKLDWNKNILTVAGAHLPGKEVKVWYMEAYCRPGSTDRDWGKTTIGHKTELVSASEDGTQVRLRCTLNDGVIVQHHIRAFDDNIDFQVTATNPTAKESLAHWAQPCVRVDRFTGRTQKTYLDKSFVFYDGKLTRMPTPHWATKARYTPGQVWAPKNVNRNDVNPRPLSDVVPSHGMIGCFSADESMVLASAWEPYQELFQGVIVCLHSDFRIGGLKPQESKHIRGKLYLMPANIKTLLQRYRKDFPEHHADKK